jgi:hypothetical protein
MSPTNESMAWTINDVMHTFTVHFRGPCCAFGRRETANRRGGAQVQSESLKGWLMESWDNAECDRQFNRNRSLSERRAQAVIDYLGYEIQKTCRALRRLVQHFRYGSLNPVASK